MAAASGRFIIVLNGSFHYTYSEGRFLQRCKIHLLLSLYFVLDSNVDGETKRLPTAEPDAGTLGMIDVIVQIDVAKSVCGKPRVLIVSS